MSDVAKTICSELQRRRVVARKELPELDDLTIRDEVIHRLDAVGLALLEYPGIPFVAVATEHNYRDADGLAESDLDRNGLGVLCYLWLQLIAPVLYGEHAPAPPYPEIVISEDALAHDLPGKLHSTVLKSTVTRLVRLRFIERVRGTGKLRAGPMLWLGINHEVFMRLLRADKGLPFAVQRVQQQEDVG